MEIQVHLRSRILGSVERRRRSK